MESSSRILQSVDRASRDIVHRLQRLQEIGTALSSERDLGKLLSMILKESRSLLCADSGSVFIREDEVETNPAATAKDDIHRVTPYLSLKVAQNDSIFFPFREMRLPFDEKTIAGHVAASGRTVNIADVYQIPAGSPYSYSTAFDRVSGYRCKSMLVVPMRNRDGEIIGVLQLINKKIDPSLRLTSPAQVESGVTTFNDIDIELVTSFASQAAVCVDTAKLHEEIERMFDGLVTSFTLSLEKRNRTTYGHCRRVAQYALEIAEAVNRTAAYSAGRPTFSTEELRQLRYAALLHDIGKIAVPEAVLDKRNKLLDPEIEAIAYRFHYWKERQAKEEGARAKDRTAKLDAWLAHVRRINVPRGMTDEDARILAEIRSERFLDVDGQEKPLLTDREFENLAIRRGNLTPSERKEIEQHIVDTWEILKRIPWPKALRRVPHIAATHHEKMNGSGYPWGLKGDDLSLGGRILAIVDIYEALTAKDRPYKPAIPVDQALKILEEEVAKGNLDADLFRLFVDQKIHGMFMDATGHVDTRSLPAAAKEGAPSDG